MAANNVKARERTTKPATRSRAAGAPSSPSSPAAGSSGPARTATATATAKAKASKATGQIHRTGLSTNLKVTLGLVAVALVAVIGVVVANRADVPAPAAVAEALVRPDSHRLSSAADGKATVVEFLDFECGSCLAAYPGVEKLRGEYGDRITYVVRYFPISSHPNAYTAAYAAEAAARQGKFEAMYKKLFDTQDSWGNKRQSQAAVFEGYARELGLDLDRFKADVASAEVAARIKADAADGESLGVQGTPTFFVNGTRYTDRPTYDGLKAAIDKALAG
jgi:protein-disulfide isomerase